MSTPYSDPDETRVPTAAEIQSIADYTGYSTADVQADVDESTLASTDTVALTKSKKRNRKYLILILTLIRLSTPPGAGGPGGN